MRSKFRVIAAIADEIQHIPPQRLVLEMHFTSQDEKRVFEISPHRYGDGAASPNADFGADDSRECPSRRTLFEQVTENDRYLTVRKLHFWQRGIVIKQRSD